MPYKDKKKQKEYFGIHTKEELKKVELKIVEDFMLYEGEKIDDYQEFISDSDDYQEFISDSKSKISRYMSPVGQELYIESDLDSGEVFLLLDTWKGKKDLNK